MAINAAQIYMHLMVTLFYPFKTQIIYTYTYKTISKIVNSLYNYVFIADT